jgi:hypothetical protein
MADLIARVKGKVDPTVMARETGSNGVRSSAAGNAASPLASLTRVAAGKKAGARACPHLSMVNPTASS